MIDLTLAQAKVASIARAETWYSTLLGVPPDRRPMAGLIEWRFGPAHGLQVFEDETLAGKSAVVLGVTDLDAEAERLDQAGIEHGGPQPGGGGQLIVLSDPDGNQVVLVDPSAGHGHSPGDIEMAALRFERTIDAPIDRVWESYADVARRSEWSVPEGEAIRYEASDFAVGGVDRYRCGSPDDLSNHVTSRYLHVVPTDGFVATSELARDGEVVAFDTSSWQLRPRAQSTELVVTVHVTSLAGGGVVDAYRQGHELVLDQLERYLAAAGA